MKFSSELFTILDDFELIHNHGNAFFLSAKGLVDQPGSTVSSIIQIEIVTDYESSFFHLDAPFAAFSLWF